MKIQSKSNLRGVQALLAVAFLSLGFNSLVGATPTTADQADTLGTVSTETHFIYPGAGIGGIGDDE